MIWDPFPYHKFCGPGGQGLAVQGSLLGDNHPLERMLKLQTKPLCQVFLY